jgi:hypothetical protein
MVRKITGVGHGHRQTGSIFDNSTQPPCPSTLLALDARKPIPGNDGAWRCFMTVHYRRKT